MIDFIKISTTAFDSISLFKSPLLHFTGLTDLDTNEIVVNDYGTKKYIASYKGLKITVYDNVNKKLTLSIKGSIHKFFNNGVHNYDDFIYENLTASIDKLGELFFFNPDNIIISYLEDGVNINPPIETLKILNGLLSHQNKRFKSISMDDAEYYQAEHCNYYLKAYDKAKHYRAKGYLIDGDILRVELKYKKMNDLITLLQKRGILKRDYMVLSDLKNIDVLVALGELLVKKWNEILFYDCTISKKKLSKSKIRKLDALQNINRWEELTKQQKFKERTLLKELVKNHSQQVQLQISNLIQEKIQSLLQKGLPFNQFDTIKKGDHLTTINDESWEGERGPFNSILIELNSNLFNDIDLGLENESICPDYDVFHSDLREIPF